MTCAYDNTKLGAARTAGFWASHLALLEDVWPAGTIDTTLCGRSIDSSQKLMGAFYSNVTKKPTGVKRTSLDQARILLLPQLLAAELNYAAFGSIPSGGVAKFTAWEAAYCGTNLKTLAIPLVEAGVFNLAGDSPWLTPGTGANEAAAKAVANILFWDILP